jgi:hypothetical protein
MDASGAASNDENGPSRKGGLVSCTISCVRASVESSKSIACAFCVTTPLPSSRFWPGRLD